MRLGTTLRWLLSAGILASACARKTGEPAGSAGAPIASPRAAGTSVRAPACRLPGELAPCRKACAAGDQESCAVLGLIHVNNRKHRDLTRAVSLLRRSCGAGAQLGCGGLGSLYVAGVGVRRDVSRGRALFTRACRLGDGLSCESLGGLLTAGRIVARNLPEAARWYEKACHFGRPAACAFLASFIRDGIVGVRASRAQVPRLLKKACDGRVSTACKMLGDLYARGDGVPKAPSKARALYRQACTLGSALACRLQPQ